MISVKLTIPPEVEDFFDGLNDEDISDLLMDASDGFCGPGGVLEQHFNKGQSSWGEPDEDYQALKERRYGNSEKFVKTGAAKDAISSGKGQHLEKQVTKTATGHRIEVALVRMEGGRNVYSIAQAGGKNSSGPPMRITQALPGDDEIIVPYVEASFKRMMAKKGLV